MNQQVDRSEKLKKKLHTSEAARVAAVRRGDLARNRVIELSQEVADLKAANKRHLYEIGKLESEADSLREKTPHVGARIAIEKMEAEISQLRTTIAMRDGAILGLDAVIAIALDECEAQKTVHNVEAMDAVIAVLRGGE